jgi:hypothetical protein
VTRANRLARTIDRAFTHDDAFEYVIFLYEHWYDLSKHRHMLHIPSRDNNKEFRTFLRERNININNILSTIEFNYTDCDKLTKSYSYYKTLKF